MNIRALERSDLHDIHRLNNLKSVMSYWFEEPYESTDELHSLYEKHIHDNTERRFVIEDNGVFAGVIELVEISFLHRNCEIQVAVFPEHEGKGLASRAMAKGIEYAFNILNLHKVYLYVDVDNEKAVNIYKKLGFELEGCLKEQFFAAGSYHDSYYMGLLVGQFKDTDENLETDE